VDAVHQNARALRKVEVGRSAGADAVEARRRHADDPEGDLIDGRGLAERGCGAAETPFGEAKARHGDRSGGLAVVRGADQAAGGGRRPEDSEEAARDVESL